MEVGRSPSNAKAGTLKATFTSASFTGISMRSGFSKVDISEFLSLVGLASVLLFWVKFSELDSGINESGKYCWRHEELTPLGVIGSGRLGGYRRSEERRVGKECR